MTRYISFITAIWTQVNVNFTARTAGANIAHLPEVVLFSETQNVVGIDIGHFRPELRRFVISFIDGGIEAIFGQFPDIGQQFPSPADGLFLIVVAKGPVA